MLRKIRQGRPMWSYDIQF